MAAFAALERGTKAESVWESVSATKSDLPCLVLALECRLGLSKVRASRSSASTLTHTNDVGGAD